MEFIDKLEEDQRNNALMIAQEAKRMGISPRLAVSLAYQESGLRTPKKPGAHGEIGIMQIKPATAEMIGFSREAIDNPEENIKAGLTYLKMGLDKFNDPVLAVAGYNAGHDHPYFTNPEKGLPETTKNYLKSIKGMGGFSEPEVQPEEPADKRPGVEVSDEDLAKQKERDLAAMKARGLTDVVGAATGAAAAKGLQIGSDVMETARAVGESARAQAAAARAGIPGAPGAPAGGLPSPLGPDTRAPAGGRGTYNWAKAFGADELEARTATGMSEARQMQKQADLAKAKIAQIAPEMAPVAERGGLYLPQQTGTGPRGARTAPIPPVQGPTPPGALTRAGEAAKTAAGAVLRSPVTMGALGGLGAAEAGQEFYRRFKAGETPDIPGMMISGMGVVGGLASMAPHPIVRGLGVAASGVSPLGLYLLDKMRGKIPPEMAMRGPMPEMPVVP